MSDKKYFTAVFEVQSQNEFMYFAKQISGAMLGGPLIHGAAVTGCGWGDSMTDADRMRDFLESRGYDADAIASGEQK